MLIPGVAFAASFRVATPRASRSAEVIAETVIGVLRMSSFRLRAVTTISLPVALAPSGASAAAAGWAMKDTAKARLETAIRAAPFL
jgi:hypothetical protein